MSVPSYWWFQILATMVILVAAACAWVLALRDALNRPEWDFPPGPVQNPRLFWVAVLVLLNVAGAAVYYVTVMRQAPRR